MNSSFIELKYQTISPPRDGYEASLAAVVNNVTVVAIVSFFTVRISSIVYGALYVTLMLLQKIQALMTAIMESVHANVLPLPKFGSGESSAQPPQKHCTCVFDLIWSDLIAIIGLDYRILVQNPLVIVPRNGSPQQEYVQLDLGRIYVYTSPAEVPGCSTLSVEVEDFNVRTMLPGLVTALPLLKHTALLLHLVQSVDPESHVEPSVRISMHTEIERWTCLSFPSLLSFATLIS